MVRVFIFLLYIAGTPVFCTFQEDVKIVQQIAMKALGATSQRALVNDDEDGFDDEDEEL